MTTTTRTIDMRPYLPTPAVSNKTKRTLRDVLAVIGAVIEGLVTVAIGFCFVAGISVFLTIL